MASFFHMGGYGFFVWGSYGMLALAIVIEILVLRRQRVRALAHVDATWQEDDQ